MRLIVLSLALLFVTLPASANYVLVLKNVNLRSDPSSENPPIRSVKAGERLKLIEHVPPSKYYKVKTMLDGLTGFAYAGSGRLQIIPSYDRDDWKHWVDEDGDHQDARQEVLIAESEVPVTFKTDSNRKVKTGQWACPFTGLVLTDPSDIDVDHMVPLENAHISGGWAWSAEKREDYANDLENDEHLIAVDDGANQSKGSKGPERWELSMSPAEVVAVGEMKAGCP